MTILSVAFNAISTTINYGIQIKFDKIKEIKI